MRNSEEDTVVDPARIEHLREEAKELSTAGLLEVRHDVVPVLSLVLFADVVQVDLEREHFCFNIRIPSSNEPSPNSPRSC